MSYRDTGKQALSTVLNVQKNINVLEKYIQEASADEEEYRRNIYQIIGDILAKKKLKDILKNIKDQRLGWNHEAFDEIVSVLAEQDDFIENPFEIEEGVLECMKCGSKRVFSITRQERSADEGMTTRAQCVNCKAKWVLRG